MCKTAVGGKKNPRLWPAFPIVEFLFKKAGIHSVVVNFGIVIDTSIQDPRGICNQGV